MKTSLIALRAPLLALLCVLLLAAPALAAGKLSDEEKRSYAIGANIGRNLKQQGVTLDAEQVAKGLVEEMKGKSRLADDEILALMQQFQEEVRQFKETRQKKVADENQARGAAFREEYAKREGVHPLSHGILYRVLQAGEGDRLYNSEYVTCNYRGTLVDGTQFDATEAGKPATFKLKQIIRGWQLALKQMRVGDKWEVVIPAELAYGERGQAPGIGPNETLVFEIELVEFE